MSTPITSEILVILHETMQLGYTVRKSGLNGLEPWRKRVTELEKYNISTKYEVTTLVRQLVEKYLITHNEDSLFGINPDGIEHSSNDIIYNDTKTHIQHHFMVQLLRLVFKENFNLSFVKVNQIFYNVGQVNASIDSDPRAYTPTILEFYRQHNLSQVSTYFTLQQ